MADRLSALDVSFLHLESPTTPMHVGGVAIFQPPEAGFDYETLVSLIGERISLVPRYRQKIRWIPASLGNPVWVDDNDFDLTYHVRRSALPKPGSEAQLKDLVARVQSRGLDRKRPLWEIYLIEGLEGGRVAVMTKTHHAMVDGISAIDIGQVILDVTPEPRETPSDAWRARREPTSPELIAGVVTGWLRAPSQVVDTVRSQVSSASELAGRVAGTAVGVLSAVRSTARPAPATPLNVTIGSQRRFGMARTELDDYKRVRKAHGGTVNDVVLATVSGALRTWLQTRGERVGGGMTLRAMVPVSVRDDASRGSVGNNISSYFVDLPVGEPSPVMRLHQVSHAMSGLKESGQSIGADVLIGLGGFAPPTLLAMGARAAGALTRRLFNLVVTNVPGPQFPLYAAGAQMLEMFPVVPLANGQGVCIALTSYNGGVYYGINADRDAIPDVDVLAQCIEESLAELMETVR
ncbi:MAG TPA: wax ester/triacylglycerol synthase family O-acyltransferase [Mycobacteriales bacterium]|jgi:WS/DGAT/MGAT family acyltransferase|nr:wax ester/triacylglycerol synthase family O-acyltransferase [Mycobacteriales bacterium]